MLKIAPFLIALLPLAGCTVYHRNGPPPASDFPASSPSDADNVGWEKLGELSVNGTGDRDSLPVGRAEGRFAKLRLRVLHSALKMHNVVVVFDDGTSFSPDTRLVFNAGTTSSVIDLPGTRRAIRRVDFRYSDLAGGGRAHVEVWAR